MPGQEWLARQAPAALNRQVKGIGAPVKGRRPGLVLLTARSASVLYSMSARDLPPAQFVAAANDKAYLTMSAASGSLFLKRAGFLRS